MDSSLTTGEKRQLKEHESTIERGLSSFVEVGKALLAIKEGKLYTDHSETFEGYCKKRWNFGKSHAYRYIDAAKVVENLSPIGDIEPPKTESVARVLAEIGSETKQADAWAKINETAPKDKAGNPKITAALARKVVEQVAPKPKAKSKPKEAATPAQAKGKPTIDARKFQELSDHLGKGVRMASDLCEKSGGAEHRDKVRGWLGQAIAEIEVWRKYAGAV